MVVKPTKKSCACLLFFAFQAIVILKLNITNMAKFKRTISWKMLSLYGLGNILGAGIYVLISEVAKESGDGLVWSFVLAGVVALFTGITYGALSSKYPVSAGAAIYSERAFKSKRLGTIIGLSMALTAVVSASALLNGFVRFFNNLTDTISPGSTTINSAIIILALLAILGTIAFCSGYWNYHKLSRYCTANS
jgi:amino acid transporter